MNPFNIEDQYQAYLKLIGLKEVAMHPEQKRQLKHAFYGAWGQLLICMRDDVSALSDDKGAAVLVNMLMQVQVFAQAEADKHSARNN